MDGLRSFVGLAIELLIGGSHAADGAGFQLSRSGSKKANSYHLVRSTSTGAASNVLLRSVL
jgi:hypothetical protein